MPFAKTILSLCDYTGAWSDPYRDAGYDVIMVDLANGKDVRLLPYPTGRVHGILAAPPCTHFALSGTRNSCSSCNGSGIEGDWRDRRPCNTCNGTGTYPC